MSPCLEGELVGWAQLGWEGGGSHGKSKGGWDGRGAGGGVGMEAGVPPGHLVSCGNTAPGLVMAV